MTFPQLAAILREFEDGSPTAGSTMADPTGDGGGYIKEISIALGALVVFMSSAWGTAKAWRAERKTIPAQVSAITAENERMQRRVEQVESWAKEQVEQAEERADEDRQRYEAERLRADELNRELRQRVETYAENAALYREALMSLKIANERLDHATEQVTALTERLAAATEQNQVLQANNATLTERVEQLLNTLKDRPNA